MLGSGDGTCLGPVVVTPMGQGRTRDLPEAFSEAPELSVEQVAQQADEAPGSWWVTWRIRNEGEHSLQLVDAYMPHGKFRGPRVDLSSVDPVVAGAARELQLAVVFEEPPPVVVENTFLILTAIWRQASWRILIRMTVESDRVGAPVAKTKLITAQRVGFSISRSPASGRELC